MVDTISFITHLNCYQNATKLTHYGTKYFMASKQKRLHQLDANISPPDRPFRHSVSIFCVIPNSYKIFFFYQSSNNDKIDTFSKYLNGLLYILK